MYFLFFFLLVHWYFPAALPLASVFRASDPPLLPIVFDVPRCTAFTQGSILNCDRQNTQKFPTGPRAPPGDPDDTLGSDTATATSNSDQNRGQINFPLANTTGSLGRLYMHILGSEALRNVVGVKCDCK